MLKSIGLKTRHCCERRDCLSTFPLNILLSALECLDDRVCCSRCPRKKSRRSKWKSHHFWLHRNWEEKGREARRLKKWRSGQPPTLIFQPWNCKAYKGWNSNVQFECEVNSVWDIGQPPIWELGSRLLHNPWANFGGLGIVGRCNSVVRQREGLTYTCIGLSLPACHWHTEDQKAIWPPVVEGKVIS